MQNFSSTIFKSYAVEASTRGRITFGNSMEECLIIARNNILGIYSFQKDTLECKKEIELFAHIKSIKRIPSLDVEHSDNFFLLADDLTYSFASLDNGTLASKYDGEIKFPSSQSLEFDLIKVISDVD